MKPLDKNLGQLLRARRITLGLTQAELAHRCGISRRHLVAIERGANFTVAVLVALAGELDASALIVAVLLEGTARPRT